MKRILIGLCLLGTFQAQASLVITTSTTATDFSNSIVGSDIMINDSSVSYIGVENQGGFFTGGISAGIGIESGIILTSGNANNAVGPNSGAGISTSLNTAGDTDLNSLSGGTTNDANALEFEFTTTTGDLFFNYVLASEEYNEFLNFADPFALLVNGINIAEAPDGDIVSVGTVNCGPTGVDLAGPNCDSFNNNTGALFDIEYDGFTDVFQASITGLTAGVNSIKFVVADLSDTALDTAVFIEAGSFSGTDPADDPISASAPASLSGLGILLIGLFRFRRTFR